LLRRLLSLIERGPEIVLGLLLAGLTLLLADETNIVRCLFGADRELLIDFVSRTTMGAIFAFNRLRPPNRPRPAA
jgi:hypothetical protein